jgi:transcriptional regulator with XRE-family HTH domain
MTIEEIAELCGVDRSTVWRWAQKDSLLQNAKGMPDDPVQNAQGITEKLEEARKSGKDPADFTLDETLAIIGEGGGNKALASLLAENARNKDALVIQDASPVIAGVFANLAKQMARTEALIEQQSALLDDPKKAAYDELEKFVSENLAVDEKGHHDPLPVWHLYHAYEKIAEKPLNEHDFAFKIALDHPEFKLVYKRKDWAFDRCYCPHVL